LRPSDSDSHWHSLSPHRPRGKLVTKTMRGSPIRAGNYEVVSDTVRTPAPRLAGSIVRMHARMVDSAGRPMSPQRLRLHHVVFLNLGARTGDRHDGSCPELPRERFYGNGEEDEELQLPSGYGYPVGARDRWRMSWMVMNHRNQQEKELDRVHGNGRRRPDADPGQAVLARCRGVRQRFDLQRARRGGPRRGARPICPLDSSTRRADCRDGVTSPRRSAGNEGNGARLRRSNAGGVAANLRHAGQHLLED
jgi:hypothetical protein